MIKAAIYDMDGLIIDSEPYWRKAMMAVFAQHQLYITEADCAQTTGMRFDNVVAHWFKENHWDKDQKQIIINEVIEQVAYYITHFATPKPGFYESLDFFKSKNILLSIASSSALKLIEATIAKLNIKNEMTVYVSAEHLSHGKPHPEVFLHCAAKLHQHPKNCLVLEDSLYGVIAAKAAQMTCIAIPEKENLYNPKFTIADYLFSSLAEVNNISL